MQASTQIPPVNPTPARVVQVVKSAYDKIGTTCPTDFDSLAAALETACRETTAPAKEQLPGFNPCRLGDRLNDNGNLVHNANVLGVTVGVLDYDALTPEQYGRLCADLDGYSAFVYTSPSDGLVPGVRKARVVVELDRELAPDECARWRDGMARVLDVGEADASTFSPHTIFFFGRVAGSAPREFRRFRGALVPSANVLMAGKARPKAEPAPPPADFDSAPAETWELLAVFVAERMIDGRKHRTMFELGGWLRQRGLSEHDVETFARALLEARAASHGDVTDVEHGVRTCLDGFNGHSVHGWNELAELFEGGADFARELDARTPNPKRDRKAAERDALASLIPDAPVSPAIGADGAPSAPAWLRPVDDSDDGPLYRRLVAEGFDLARGCVTAVQGPPRRGKTPLMFQLLYAIANGSRFLDLQCERGKCALFTWEKVAATKARKATVARAMGVDRGGVELFVVSAPLTLQTAAELAAFIRAQGFDAVGIDTLNSAMGSADQNEMGSAAPLKALALALPDTAIVVSVYERKSAAGADSDLQSVAGSNAIGGGFDAAVRLKPADGSRNKYTLESTRELTTEPKPIEIEARGDEHAMCFHVVEPDVLGAGATAVELTSEKQKLDRAIQQIENVALNWHAIMPALQDGMTVRQWADQIRMSGGGNYSVVRRALDELTKADVLRCDKGLGRNGSSNKYRPPRDDDAGVIAERVWQRHQASPRVEHHVPAVPNR